MLFDILKRLFGFISSNVLLIINICYYIRKLNYHELFSESSSKDLIQLNINLNLIDLAFIFLIYLLLNVMPQLKRLLFQNITTNDQKIADYLNKSTFRVTLLDSKSILIENESD